MQNKISLINEDPLLSQFKYHFILRRVYMPRTLTLEQFALNAHQGFGLPSLTSDSIYILQMVNVYDEDRVDLAVGFRRDELATKIARQVTCFQYLGYQSQLELASGFRIFMDQLQSEEKMDEEFISDGNFHSQLEEPKNQQPSAIHISNSKPTKKRKNSEEFVHCSLGTFHKKSSNAESKNFQCSSRSRSREKKERKKELRDRLTPPVDKDIRLRLLLIPFEVKPSNIISRIEKEHPNCIVTFGWHSDPTPYLEIIVKQSIPYARLMESMLLIGCPPILVVEGTQDIKEELFSRQVVYDSISGNRTMAHLLEEIQQSFKQENIIVNILEIGKMFIATFLKPVNEYSKYSLKGWSSRRNNGISPFRTKPSLQDKWYVLTFKSNTTLQTKN